MPGPLVVLDNLTLLEGADPISALFEAGQCWAIMGRAGAGKSLLIDVLLTETEPVDGSVTWACDYDFADIDQRNRRVSPQKIASQAAGRDADRATIALKALHLWEDREAPAADLTPSQTIASGLLECLAGTSPVCLIDGYLDALDPWARADAVALVKHQAETEDRCFIVVTALEEVAERLGHMLVLQYGSPVFSGPVRDLAAQARPIEYEIETDDRSTMKSMAEPLALTIRDTEHGLIFQAKPGQENAVKLLLQGYGTIKAIAIREPRLGDALRQLL